MRIKPIDATPTLDVKDSKRIIKDAKKQVEDFDKQYGHYTYNGKTKSLNFNNYLLKYIV